VGEGYRKVCGDLAVAVDVFIDYALRDFCLADGTFHFCHEIGHPVIESGDQNGSFAKFEP
jgi:hypothetical protein